MITEKFKNFFDFAPKSSIKAGDGLNVGNFPFYTSSSILSKRIDKAIYNDEALIFGTGGSASIHCANEPFSTSTDCIVAITKSEEFNAKFVYYYLFGNIHILERGFKGAGLKHISKKYIENIDIPVLPFETQNKIVAVLDKVSSIVNKRQASIKLYETFLKSTFLDYFGDPVLNTKKWEKLPLSGFGEIITGNTPPRINPEYYNNNHLEWIKTDNIIKEGVYPTQANEYLSEKGSEVGRIVVSGAVLVACIAGSLSSIGRVALVNRKLAFNQQINAIQPNPNISPVFLFYLIRNSSEYIQSYATKGMKKIITKGVFQKIQFINPPHDLQLKFETVTSKINESCLKIYNSQAEISSLFNSLMQKVFNGQLNFNVDFELDALVREIDLQKKENDLSKIVGDIAYLQRLVDKLNSQEFKEKDLYDKAKHGVFQLLKAGDKVEQIIKKTKINDKEETSLILSLK